MARRSKGEGSYLHIVPVKCEKCKDFTECTKRLDATSKCRKRDQKECWKYQYNVPGINGKPVRKILQAKTRKLLDKRIEQLHAESEICGSAVTVDQWLNRWCTAVIPDTVVESTVNNYKFLLSYIPEDFRRKKLSELTPASIQQLFTNLREHGRKSDGKGLSVKSVRNIRATFIACLNAAIDNGLITTNTAQKTKPPRYNSRREISFLNEDEIQRLLDVADSGKYYKLDEQSLESEDMQYLIKQWSMVIRLTLATGMRRGEVFGLTWDSVDFNNKTISIKHKLRNGKLEPPKTKNSVRTISIDPDSMKKLQEWKNYQEQYAFDLDDLFHNRLNTVFTGIFGNPVQLDNFRERVFDRMVAEAGLADTITMHSLRHTHATQLLAAGVDAKTVSYRLGHASVAFTLETYVHVVEDVERAAAETMGAILAGKKVRKTVS